MISSLWSEHPRGLSVLFFTEMWERFSYYGMRAILVLAMVASLPTGGMGIDREQASAIYGLYTASGYLASLPGGWIADRILGAQRAVWYGGIIIAAGHFTMAVPTTQTFYLGMVLIALGTGLLKPNISAMVGAMYADDPARRDAGFSIFYMGINLGAFIGQLVCGYLGENVGWHWGFGAAGVFMTLGLIQYRLRLPLLEGAGEAPASSGDAQRDQQRRRRDSGWLLAGLLLVGTVVVLGLGGHLSIDAVTLSKYTTVAITAIAAAFILGVLLFGQLDAGERRRVGVIAILFVAAAVFWSGFEQAGSSFNLFALDHTDRMILGWEFPASWLQSINPLLIILLTPFFAALWINLGRRNLNPSVPAKFVLALAQLALGFLVLYFAAQFVVAGDKVLPTWLLLTYLLHTTGELCLSPVGLSAVTQLSPKRYVGQMMGVWFMAASLGYVIAGLLAGEISGEDSVAQMPANFLRVTLFAGGAALLLALLLGPIRRLSGEASQKV
ncbi:MAG TPA: peptide MFS transporter [Solimonas sp.]|nr:peptide MFS transporter [Solimonas sp.]